MSAIVAPSILSSDFSEMKTTLLNLKKAKADYIHVDVMDGNFVPNITFGPKFVTDMKKHTDIPLDVHLMIEEPGFFAKAFISSGADILTVHYEGNHHLNKVITSIKNEGVRAGLAINPHTSLSSIEGIIKEIDHLLIMSVNPGFGGQVFIESSYEKISQAKELIEKKNPSVNLAVDGGITLSNVSKVIKAGANFIVAGTAIFSTDNMSKAIETIKSS